MNNLNKSRSFKSNMAKLSQNWLEVLIPFSYNYDVKLSGSEVARIIRIPQRSVSRYLAFLVKENILKFEEKGNNNLYYLDLSDERIKIILNLVESYKSFVFSRNNLLWKNIKDLSNFGTLILFGSQVKGNQTSFSDIDLVIFAKNTEKLKKVLRNIPKVQAQVISFEAFEKLLFKKDVLALEILDNHVIFGELDRFIDLSWRFYNGEF